MAGRKRSAGLLAAVLTGSLIWSVAPALSQQPVHCGNRTDVMAQLAEKYGEHPAALGLTAGGNIVELTVSDSGSWTLMMSFPQGRTCLMASGEQWEQITTSPKPPGTKI